MTREEAITLINSAKLMLINPTDNEPISDLYTALEMAIKALEQESCEDMVHIGTLHQIMWERDIAIEQLKELGYELGQKIEPCEDAISRQAVLKQTYNWSKDEFLRVTNPFDYLRKRIKDLPPVTQKSKTGQYEKHIDHTDCIYSEYTKVTTCSQYRDGWNDAMDYIFKNGKGYQPYRKGVIRNE